MNYEGDRLVLPRQLQASISILQRERGSEALARDQVHENKDCQSQMTMTTCETKKDFLLIRMIETCAAAGSNLAASGRRR